MGLRCATETHDFELVSVRRNAGTLARRSRYAPVTLGNRIRELATMDFSLSEEQTDLRDLARQILSRISTERGQVAAVQN